MCSGVHGFHCHATHSRALDGMARYHHCAQTSYKKCRRHVAIMFCIFPTHMEASRSSCLGTVMAPRPVLSWSKTPILLVARDDEVRERAGVLLGVQFDSLNSASGPSCAVVIIWQPGELTWVPRHKERAPHTVAEVWGSGWGASQSNTSSRVEEREPPTEEKKTRSLGTGCVMYRAS